MPACKGFQVLIPTLQQALNKESYVLLDAKVSYRLTKFAQFFVRGENLLDQEYETLRYYTMPGVTVFTGINLNF